MKPAQLRSCCLALHCLLWLAPVVFAADDGYEALKNEIQSRAYAVQQAKANGSLAEGGDGLLMAGGTASAESAELLRQENQARQRMFGLIASRTKDDPAKVAATFASLARLHAASAAPVPVRTPQSGTPTPGSPPAPVADVPFVPVQPGSRVPLRLLTRPLAVLRESAASSSAKGGALPAFSVLIARRQEAGGYLVSDRVDGPVKGWLDEKDVIEWRHNLVASFTHPDGRNRAVIVREKGTLKELLAQGPGQGMAFMRKYLGTPPPEDFLGAEPEGWARLENQFFLLPITDHELVPSDNTQDSYILRVSAATQERGARPRGGQARPVQQPARAAPKIDLVFVMDLSRSMGPFVARTRQMLGEIASSLSGGGLAPDTVAFGFWGYRDDPALCQGIEFNTRNFTPQLQSLPDFTRTLGMVDETRVDSVDYAEDVYAGVHDAIKHTNWRDGAAKFILLVGDAPGRGIRETEDECQKRPRPVGTACRMNPEELRQAANAQGVAISAVYLEAPQWRQFTDRAERQFRVLGTNPSSNRSTVSFALINASNPSDYAACARDFAGKLGDNLRTLASRNELPTSAPVPSGMNDPGAAGRQMADNVFRSAMIEWASARKEQPMPSDIDGWVLDKDPADPSKTALEACVLLNRDQLDSLKLLTDDLVNAGLRAQLATEDFFSALLAVSATGTRDPERLRNARDLQQAGLIPDFLQGLPYKSLVMTHSQESWRAMSTDEKNQFINTVDSKLRYYQHIYEDTGKWARLNPNDDEAAKVYAVPLMNLP